MTATQDVDLTVEQRDAIEEIVHRKDIVKTLGGYAGTGKTTVIKTLTRRLKYFAVCAFTGKAAQVLRRKGVQASTIHSLIYKPIEEPDGGVRFELKDSMDVEFDGVIVDEASMVSEQLHNDLKSFCVPLIYVGDHGQLPPVGSANFNLMAKPDITLEKIHRNAGVIARFAEHLRKGNAAKDWVSEQGLDEVEHNVGSVNVMTNDQFSQSDVVGPDDQMICAYNRTRVMFNHAVRDHLGRANDMLPVVGDRIMCLQNNRDYGLFNGMQGEIAEIDHNRRRLTFASGDLSVRVPYVAEAFGAERTPERRPGVIPFDWCYCVTAHKSQGDEWDHVIVIEQRCQHWEHSRWAYTSASRAKNRLTWVLES